MKSFIKSRDSPAAMEAKKITFYERRKKHEYSEKILDKIAVGCII